VLTVTETRNDTKAVSTKTYSDQDGDGKYVESFDLTVASGSINTKAPTHQFTFNTDGTIATDNISHKKVFKSDTINTNEVYQQVVLGSDTYVTKTTSSTDGNFMFQLFRDDNADGTWSEIAAGHSSGTNIDTTSNSITLTGIQTLLSSADSIIG
jgi:hypothetical protein